MLNSSEVPQFIIWVMNQKLANATFYGGTASAGVTASSPADSGRGVKAAAEARPRPGPACACAHMSAAAHAAPGASAAV